MQFSERWLRTLADPPLDTAALCDKLTMGGFEVEEARSVAPPFSGVVVARIDAVAPHPNADRLRVCEVDAGTGSALAIVCGAPNAAVGMKVPCALPGIDLAYLQTVGLRMPHRLDDARHHHLLQRLAERRDLLDLQTDGGQGRRQFNARSLGRDVAAQPIFTEFHWKAGIGESGLGIRKSGA